MKATNTIMSATMEEVRMGAEGVIFEGGSLNLREAILFSLKIDTILLFSSVKKSIVKAS